MCPRQQPGVAAVPAAPRAIVVHGVSHVAELAYRDRLAGLAASPARVRYVPVVSRPSHPDNAGWIGLTGRLDAQLDAVCDAHRLDPAASVAYLCGNPEMIATAERILGPARLRARRHRQRALLAARLSRPMGADRGVLSGRTVRPLATSAAQDGSIPTRPSRSPTMISLKVRDVMTQDVVTVEPETPLKDVARLMIEYGVSGIPVVDPTGLVVGVVSEADLLVKERGEGGLSRRPLAWLLGESKTAERELVKIKAVAAREAMTRPALTIGPDRPLREAADLMIREQVNRLPVVGRAGRLVGIVTRADVVRAFVATRCRDRGDRP